MRDLLHPILQHKESLYLEKFENHTVFPHSVIIITFMQNKTQKFTKVIC
jgi:hypothetical protein